MTCARWKPRECRTCGEGATQLPPSHALPLTSATRTCATARRALSSPATDFLLHYAVRGRGRLLQSPFDEINAFQQAIAEKVDSMNPGYAKQYDNKFFIGFEGRCVWVCPSVFRLCLRELFLRPACHTHGSHATYLVACPWPSLPSRFEPVLSLGSSVASLEANLVSIVNRGTCRAKLVDV